MVEEVVKIVNDSVNNSINRIWIVIDFLTNETIVVVKLAGNIVSKEEVDQKAIIRMGTKTDIVNNVSDIQMAENVFKTKDLV